MTRIPIRLSTKSKYYAKREGKYASKKEAKRAGELALMQQIGAIRELEEQVRFTLIPKDEMGGAIEYVADFAYLEKQQSGLWVPITEDVKGVETAVYKLKKRLMWKVYGVKIRET